MMITRVAVLTVTVISLGTPSWAGPVEFGSAELNAALASRKINSTAVRVDLNYSAGPAECFAIADGRISGSDARGLMYGLLEAAEQIRASRRLINTHTCPATVMRGIRYFVHNEELDRKWYYSEEYWSSYFAMLARNRFNRFNLVFAHQTNYLAPPYPFWLDVPEFSSIRVPGLTTDDRDRNLRMLQYISHSAADHGIDFTLGIWEQNVGGSPLVPNVPTVAGLTSDNIGPYTYTALKKVLQLCPEIHSVQLRTNAESGIAVNLQLKFYRDYVFAAIRDAGRPITLDLRGWAVTGDLIPAVEDMHLPLRVSTKYWGEHMGRPYQPAETFANYSYLDFLKKPRAYEFYWELWGLGSNRFLLWGNPDYVRRAVSTFRLGDASGFEIDPPLAQKGFGNAPGAWDVFTPAHRDWMFWKWDFERYWLFYKLWGRLSYNPAESDDVWLTELNHRFGAAAPDVLAAYRNASGIINEIVATHLADPNMYISPEINPGGILDYYRDTLPGDWRFVASIPESVQARIQHSSSAKQTPQETAANLNALADRTEQAIARAQQHMRSASVEWPSTKADFRVLTLLARYHAYRQTGVYQTTYFDATGDRSALNAAQRDLAAAVHVWEQLVALSDSLYSAQMAFGPEDVGHWKDKLAYVRYDLDEIRQREEVDDRFGRFAFAFDFGEHATTPSSGGIWTKYPAVISNTVAPRFTVVDSDSIYTNDTGFGWLSNARRETHAIPLIPYAAVRAVDRNGMELPHDVLYSDFIVGQGPQVFRINAQPGRYQIHFLHPDHSVSSTEVRTSDTHLDVVFPTGEWSVSGLIVQTSGISASLNPQVIPTRPPRPRIEHEAAETAEAGQPLRLTLRISAASKVARITLHYRALNQRATFKSIERVGGDWVFTIPASDVTPEWDLMYYFEVLNGDGSGWFFPDPQVTTPYRVVRVQVARRE
jgi:hypothetical protein